MPDRFVFRQVFSGDFHTFLNDGELRAKNHACPQRCHQTSYPEIVDRRGTQEFPMPCGGVVNDYVPFYFSPLTSFTFTIHRENVPLRSPDGQELGMAKDENRIFFVCRADKFVVNGLECCFSDFALNSMAPLPTVEVDLGKLETHVHWDVFDEQPISAKILEIGYDGVCRYFQNAVSPPSRQYRSQKRMAEFLVRGAVPLTEVSCIVAKSDAMRHKLQLVMTGSEWDIPIYSKPGCYF